MLLRKLLRRNRNSPFAEKKGKPIEKISWSHIASCHNFVVKALNCDIQISFVYFIKIITNLSSEAP